MQGALWGTILTLLVASVAQAQTTIDVSEITCEQFALLKVGVPQDYLEIWISGYYHGKRGDTKVEMQKLKDNAEKIRSYCLYNKGTLMEAVENVLSAER